METDTNREFLSVMEDGHLGAEASALLVEALRWGKMTQVPENLLTHVEACRECKDNILEVVTFFRNPDSTVERKRKIAGRTKSRRDWYFYRGKIAAAFVVFVLLASAYFYIYKSPSFNGVFLPDSTIARQENKIQGKTTTPMPGEKSSVTKKTVGLNPGNKVANNIKADAAKTRNGQTADSRYRVNPNLENMIGSRLRSGLFDVLGPGNGSILTAPIPFAWKKELTNPHTLKIVNNKNDVLYTYPVQGSSFTFRGSLASGLYYWKLESQNELLYVGKFFIGKPPSSLSATHRD
jgi:hypothetical protein